MTSTTKVYILKNGTAQAFGNLELYLRDKRKLLIEITPRGNITLLFKTNQIELTKEQLWNIFYTVKQLVKP